ncbi:MAG: DUF1254 domain-containing protein [Alphaproteobacteria bacterium]|nr:DUF1254 domain-containing protein [Alphaproteobacteria bacterium]
MKGWLPFLLVVAIVGVAAHAATVIATPRAIMNVAMTRLAENGGPGWRHAPRTTADARNIVRPSPDLAYSACVYDLADGPMTITMAPSEDYWSLSLYAANSDNFFTRNDRAAREGVAITLVRRGAAPPPGATEVVESPSARGVAIQRRLAPTAGAYAIADAARRGDLCEAFAAR